MKQNKTNTTTSKKQTNNPGLNREKEQKEKEYKTPKAMAGKTFNLE